jgi:hypothetical protein
MPTIYLKRTSPLMAQLGANIARELKKLGITQGELSERSGRVPGGGVGLSVAELTGRALTK